MLNNEELRLQAIQSVKREMESLNNFAENEGHSNVDVILAVTMRIADLEKQLESMENPKFKRDIHTYFGLSYADYLVIPRSVLQSMKKGWQYDFVELLEKLDDTNWRDLLPKGMYKVEYRNYGYEYNSEAEREEFKWKEELTDPLSNYDRGRRNIFK